MSRTFRCNPEAGNKFNGKNGHRCHTNGVHDCIGDQIKLGERPNHRDGDNRSNRQQDECFDYVMGKWTTIAIQNLIDLSTHLSQHRALIIVSWECVLLLAEWLQQV